MDGRIYIQEVVTRDGFQSESVFVPTEQKISLIDGLSEAGFHKIEVTSFVSPKAVPSLSDAKEVLRKIKRVSGVTYVALIPNVKGAQLAVESEIDEVNLVVSASETHNRANVRRCTNDSFVEFSTIMSIVKGTKVAVNGTISTSFGCPFEGTIPEEIIFGFIEKYLALGVDGITLADTTGMAYPRQVKDLVEKVFREWPEVPVTLHFHNTRGMGLANVLAGIEAGVVRYDSSLGGLGGCPFAPGATGNICTEDLVHMLQFMGYETGVNLDRLLHYSRKLPDMVGHEIPGQVVKAGKITDLHPIPLNL